MQATPEQLAEDHDHASNVEVMPQTFEHSVRSTQDLGTQGTKFEFQESYDDDATPNFERSVLLNEDLGTKETKSEDQESCHDAEEEEEFSFTLDGAVTSPIAAEDAFHNGQIKPMFPLFNQDLLLQERYLGEHSTLNQNVKKVLVEMNKQSLGNDDDVSGPYCEWEPEREKCKKSSSTGFSKLWRLKDLVVRSNSDGRDAFVFLNNRSTTTSSSDQNASSSTRKEHKRGATIGGGGGGGDEEEVVKKAGRKKTTSMSSHEIYLKNKAKENDGRKKSYMPYKQDMVGFFTNVNGGSISKNVHPY